MLRNALLWFYPQYHNRPNSSAFPLKIKYETLALRTKAVETIRQANIIIEEYALQGYSLTLRQLYYQFVARGFLANTHRNYLNLGTAISNGRRAGLIDWDAIVDRTRFLRKPSSWDSPADIIRSAADSFALDLWSEQDAYVEVWFEKDALLGVFERASKLRRLPMMSCRGYGSDSTWWEAAQRLTALNKPCIILHFGDHDPSGLDMTRDIQARLNLFGAFPDIKRLALNMDQVRKYNPPPNPAKESDSRFAEYKAQYGDESWELDALAPDVLVKLVEKEINKHIDDDLWDACLEREQEGKELLGKTAKHWHKLTKVLKQKRFSK